MKTDKEKHRLKGSVKSVRTETWQLEVQNGQTIEKRLFSNTLSFDQNGRLIEQVYGGLNEPSPRTLNVYSDSGQLLAIKAFDFAGVQSSEIKRIYDDKEVLIAEEHRAQDGKVFTPTTYKYDSENRMIKIQEHDSLTEVNVMINIEGTDTAIMARDVKRIETRSDDRGNSDEIKIFNAAGLLVNRIEIARDELGNPLEETHYVGDVVPFGECAPDSSSSEEMAAMNEEQKAALAAEIAQLFAPGAVMSRRIYSYDTKGRLIESRLMMMGMEADRQTFTYDDAGNKSAEVHYYEGGAATNKTIFERDYDERGNWIEELVLTATSRSTEEELSVFAPTRVTRRVITYW